ncbi:MAG: UvrD-helicase domain-containing protein, partial [Hyphomicrobiaceae bacterium]
MAQRADRDNSARNQARAADPGSSVWVSANAGTGKTHVLTLRVLRLLLSG